MATIKLRLVCISDTHNAFPGAGFTLPAGDILLHAGDLTNQGSLAEIEKAMTWIKHASFAAKIVVAGNHDLSVDAKYGLKYPEGWKVLPEEGEKCRELVRGVEGVNYLEHESAEVEVKGVKLRVFGSPYSPDRGGQNWALQYLPEEAEELWSAVPDDVDMLITHTPSSLGLDESKHWTQGGCEVLARRVREIRPRLHVFGHCHEGRGAEVVHWEESAEDGDHRRTKWRDPGAGNKKQSLFDLTGTRGGHSLTAGADTALVNASIMARSWGQGGKAFNKPIVVDIDIPSKRD
nr:hypothetical protein B0A51_10114 [Rachicladosporium sp. CCFEE 5018]